MNMILHNFKKDVRQLRLVVILWLATIAIQTALGVIVPSLTVRPSLWGIYQLAMHLGPALQFLFLLVLIPMVIQQDSLLDARAFWLTRPISRRTLLAGKALFLGVVVVLPVVSGEALVLACNGLPARLVLLAVPEMFLETMGRVCLIGVLAALTLNLSRFAIAGICYLVGYWIMEILVITMFFPSFDNSGFNTHDLSTGILQSQKMMVAAATMLIGCGVLAYQYLTRRNRKASALAIIGAACIVMIKGATPIIMEGDAPAQKAVAAISPDGVELAVKGIAPNANPLQGWKRTRSFNATFSFQNKQQATPLEITSGSVTMTPADGRAHNGTITTDFGKITLSQYESTGIPLSGELSEAIEQDIGKFKLLNSGTNAVAVIRELTSMLRMKEVADYDACIGQKVVVTGNVELAVFAYKSAAAPLAKGASLSFGLDADRIASITDRWNNNEKTTTICIRKRMVSLAFKSEKHADTMIDRMTLPGKDAIYFLINRKAGNEVALCESVEPDIFFMMTMGLRMMSSPPRLDYCETKISFPKMPESWMKDAELVCFKKTRIGTLHKDFVSKDVLVGAAAKKETAE